MNWTDLVPGPPVLAPYYDEVPGLTGVSEHPDRRDRVVTVSGTGDSDGDGRQRVSVTSGNRSIAFSAASSAVTLARVCLQGSP